LSDGSVSKKIGSQVNLTDSFEFSEERPIKSIRVRTDNYQIYQMEFLDAEGKVIVEIKSRDYGDNWHTIEVKEGEAIIGYQEASDTNFLRAIGFMTMKSDF